MLDPLWARKTISYVKDLVKLSEEQIYKWGYEKKRKIRSDSFCESAEIYNCKVRTESSNMSGGRDYNLMVDELFPASEWTSDELTIDEIRLYDKVKAELTSKDAVYKDMTDIDKILCERISLSDVILKAKNPSISPSKMVASTFEAEKVKLHVNVEQEDLIVEPKFESDESETHNLSWASTPSPTQNKRDKKCAMKDEIANEFEVFQSELNLFDNDFSFSIDEVAPVDYDCVSFF